MEYTQIGPRMRRRKKLNSSATYKNGNTKGKHSTSRRYRSWLRRNSIHTPRICMVIVVFLVLVVILYLLVGWWTGGTFARSSSVRQSIRRGQDSRSMATPTMQINNHTKPLDDYTARKHLFISENSNNKDSTDLPILVVGGSDGSGTRAFVDILGKLGVPMAVDDTGTLDVHAKCLFDGDGWPALIRTVLQSTHAANYSWQDLSLVQQSMLSSTMDEFVSHYGQRGKALREHGILEGFPVARQVFYGFKAPVSMLVLPILRHVYGRIKFLHVVRDGRDVAMSKNKSPVQKFYHLFYPDAKKRREDLEQIEGDIVFEEAMAMQLWNDWNTQVLDWERQQSDGQSFDYLVVRTEDLMDPSTRLASLQQLAHFVGSQKTDQDLCCLSRQPIQDMGKSGVRIALAREATALTWWEDFVRITNYWWHEIKLFLGMTGPKFGEQIVGGIKPRYAGSSERLTDEEDLPMPDALLGIEEEHNEMNQKLRQKRPDLFRRIQQRREQRFKRVKQLNMGPHHQQPANESEESASHRRLSGQNHHRNLKHGGLKRVPWRNETRKAPKVVDHIKSGTMLEKDRESDFSDLVNRRKATARRWDFSREGQPEPEPLESAEKVMERYGKWAKIVQDRPELDRILHKEGVEGLALFGYGSSSKEPKRVQFSDFSSTSTVCESFLNCDGSIGDVS